MKLENIVEWGVNLAVDYVGFSLFVVIEVIKGDLSLREAVEDYYLRRDIHDIWRSSYNLKHNL